MANQECIINMKTAIVAFGRMNPPTVGHKKLVDKLKSVATQKRGSPFLYLSHTQDKKKNPLSYEQKLKFARKAFGSVVTKSTSKTILQVMKELEGKKFTDTTIIAGSDRVTEFQTLLNKYNGTEFNMDSVTVVSAGARDPDAEGIEGMSASKLRALVVKGDFDTFVKGVPLSLPYAKQLYTSLRSVLEEYEIVEGPNDPGIFKAIFLAGGPGSGKSFIANNTGLKALGLKMINSDILFERALTKAGLKSTPDNIFSPTGQEIRNKIKISADNLLSLYLKGNLGLIIDGTGKDYEKIYKQKTQLEKLGYETAMIFVNTNIETALKRNRQRARQLPDNIIKKMWQSVQDNMGKFQSIFQENFIIADNSENKNWKKTTTDIFKKMVKFVKTPVNSKKANHTMRTETFIPLEEAILSLQQRQKRRLLMKRLAPRIARLRKIKLRRTAQKPALIKRARKAAVQLLKKRAAGEQGQNYSKLSPSQKIQIDRLVQKKLPMVDRIAKRLLPKIMKKELERMKSLRSGGSDKK